MDILSFALGMGAMVVITLMVVTVVAFVKVRKTEKTLEDFMISTSHEIAHIHDKLEKRSEEISRNINYNVETLERKIYVSESHSHRRMDDILSQMDSRFDKHYDKTNKAISILTSKIKEHFDDAEAQEENNNNKILLKD